MIKSHPKYKKVVRSTVKFHAHDEENTAGVGDTVRIIETRPLSKLKRWRLAEIVEKARADPAGIPAEGRRQHGCA